VLAGGGGKGAWQFGVLRAFHEQGGRFDVVSGTSVGALNGAIWCTGEMHVGNKIWGAMRLKRIFLLRKWQIPLVLFGTVSRLYYAFSNGYADFRGSHNLILYRIFGIVAMAPFLSVLGLFIPTPPNWFS
jgi:hypothetical protein